MCLSYLPICLGLTMVVSSYAYGQQRTVTGTVTSNQKPIAGVWVSQEGKDTVTQTNASGQYQLTIFGENAILIFKHPLYAETRVTVGNQNAINASLEKEKQIDEVVLNAGYYKVKERESTGSIAKVSAKEIENQPVNNVLSAVQGRMPGVNIVQNSGTPGGGFEVQIRGRNSLRTYLTAGYDANAPLYVIDGVPMPSLNEYKAGLTGAVLPYNDTNALNSLNPDDISSIEVLKDADATAIYGSRGANGVVLITTKRGNVGRTLVKINTSYGLGNYANLPKVMNTQDYLKMRTLAFSNDGVSNYPANAYDVNGRWDKERFTDWQKYFVGNQAEQTDTQISVSGGNSNTRFTLSGGHREETTVFPGSYRYKRNTVSTNTEHQSTDRKLKLTFTGYYSTEDNTLPPSDFKSIYGNIAPNAPALFTPEGGYNWEGGTFVNPLATASQTVTMQGRNLNANFNGQYLVTKGLSINLNAGYGYYDRAEQRIYPKTYYNPASNIGSERSSLRTGSMVNRNWILEPQLNYEKKWGKHNINTLIGSSFQDQTSNNITLLGTKFPSDELIYNLASAATVTVASSYQFHYRYQAIYSRLNYSYNEKYFLNLTARRDGSSRFGEEKRFGNFGAVGGAWILSKENFIKNIKWLSYAKLRASYGITGSDQIGDYQFYDTYLNSGGSYDNSSGLLPSRLFNKNFGWETTRKLEAALEWSMFQERISLIAAWYRNISTNQLVGIPLPATTGFTSYNANLDATVLNRGLELSLQTAILRDKAVKWNLMMNVSLPENRLLRFPNLETSTYANSFQVGKSTTLVKLYQYTGIDPITGLYTVADQNKDGIINNVDKTVVKELQPSWYGGIQQNLQYKNWTLDFLFQFTQQSQLNIYANDNYVGAVGTRPELYLDYWTHDNPEAQFQKPTAGLNAQAVAAHNLFKQSDATVSDSFSLRLRNASLSYNVPMTHTKMNVKIYLQGQNLFLWSNYKGIDPEFNLQGYTNALRVISTGLNITF